MDPTPDVLAENVRAKRTAIDNDLELLRVKTQSMVRAADPRPHVAKLGRAALPLAAGAVALLLWRRRRRSVTSLQDLLADEVTDLLNVEEQLVAGLDRLADAATNDDLRSLLDRHARETERHAARLERVLRSVGTSPRRATARAVHAADVEARQFLKRKVDDDVRDAWIIGTAQRLEHLEIASYGTARAFAETLGHTYAAQLLQQTLDEEKAMDQQLTRLAERFVNPGSIR